MACRLCKLPQKELQKIKDEKSTRPFRFGDGKNVQSTRKVTIPAKIGQTRCKIETEVVPADIPMLLSKTSLKRASAVLDIAQDKATVFDQPVKLELTSSGHYCVNLRNESNLNKNQLEKSETPSDEDEILIVTENMTTKDKKTVLLKLHKQLGHASVVRLQKRLSCSGNSDDESITILKNIIKKTVTHASDTVNQNISLQWVYPWLQHTVKLLQWTCMSLSRDCGIYMPLTISQDSVQEVSSPQKDPGR